MEAIKQPQVNDIVHILTPDEFLVKMRIIDFDQNDGTILLGIPGEQKFKAISQVVISSSSESLKLKSGDMVTVEMKDGRKSHLKVYSIIDGNILILSPKGRIKPMTLFQKLKLVMS